MSILAVQKLGLDEGLSLAVVVEYDGTDVDEDEVLAELTSKDILMVLTPGQSWSPAMEVKTAELTLEPPMIAETPEYTIIVEEHHDLPKESNVPSIELGKISFVTVVQ